MPDDLDELVEVYTSSRAAAPMPPPVHGLEAIREWLGVKLLAPAPEEEVWVAEVAGAVVAYVAFTRTWLDDLYVAPASQGSGLGTALLDLVRSLRTGGFSLWVFESNRPARAFYAARGLVEREHTDGSENEERTPDLRMEYVP
ncbi:MAG: GNAT family N-acetyltransferase [Nocardioides sp.]|nr:GNAT family N-acetyltransferase [Nocardioides sp.]